MNRINLRKLDHAIKLAETGSYADASKQLHITQSALSRSIQSLEDDLGIKLFDRYKNTGIKITSEGRAVINKAKALLIQSENFLHDMDILKEAKSSSVSFGLGPGLPSVFLPELLSTIAQSHPGLSINVEIEAAYKLTQLLIDESIEFFFSDILHFENRDHSLLNVEYITDLPIGLYAKSSHPLKNHIFQPEDLFSYPLLSAQHNSGHPVLTSKKSESNTAPELTTIRCNDLPTLTRILLNSDAVFIGLPQMLAAQISAGKVIELQFEGKLFQPYSKVCHASLRGRTLSNAANLMKSRIISCLSEQSDHK